MEELIINPNETELVAAMHSELAEAGLPMPFEQDIFLYGTEIAGTSYRENIRAAVEKITGKSAFRGRADDSVFCGRWDTRL